MNKVGWVLLWSATILAVYLWLSGCGREARVYPIIEEDMSTSVDAGSNDMMADGHFSSGRCGNGDSPDGYVGYCPCCEVRDEKCNIPDKEGEWCVACLEHETSSGMKGDMYPCRSAIP